MKILVTDGDPVVLLLASSVLKRTGYEALEAKTGTVCLEMMQAHHPDPVLLEVMLPDMKGGEMRRLIKAT
jgi:CheY-like chemotaxis protein